MDPRDPRNNLEQHAFERFQKILRFAARQPAIVDGRQRLRDKVVALPDPKWIAAWDEYAGRYV
jgi:hypothetical protein